MTLASLPQHGVFPAFPGTAQRPLRPPPARLLEVRVGLNAAAVERLVQRIQRILQR